MKQDRKLNLDNTTKILVIQINNNGTTIKFSIDKDSKFYPRFLERSCNFKASDLLFKEKDVLEYFPNLIIDLENKDVVDRYKYLLEKRIKDNLLVNSQKILEYNKIHNIFNFLLPVINSEISVSCIRELMKIKSSNTENLFTDRIYTIINILELCV